MIETPDFPSIRMLAEYMFNRGVGIAFVAITVFLLFIYFMKKIFTKEDNEAKLEEIRDLLREATFKLDQLLDKEGK